MLDKNNFFIYKFDVYYGTRKKGIHLFGTGRMHYTIPYTHKRIHAVENQIMKKGHEKESVV